MSNNEELARNLELLLKNLEEEIFEEELDGIPIKEMDEVVMGGDHQIPLVFSKISENAISPKYNYPSDSGFDLHSTLDIKVSGFGRALIPTGLKFDIPEGYEIQVRSKSGLAINQGIMVLNSPGTVDQGYDGEIKVIIYNTNAQPVEITKGQKIGQAVLTPVVAGKWVNLSEVTNIIKKERGENGFGSTGI